MQLYIHSNPQDFAVAPREVNQNPAWYVIYARHRDRKILLQVPLFPGYLFMHSSLDHQSYYEIIRQKSVVRLLGGKFGLATPVPAGGGSIYQRHSG